MKFAKGKGKMSPNNSTEAQELIVSEVVEIILQRWTIKSTKCKMKVYV